MTIAPKRILILDDMPERHEVFAEVFQALGHVHVHTYTYAEACTELAKGGWDEVYLDHDLGDAAIDCDATIWLELTGTAVVTYLVNIVPSARWPKRVIVHSWNRAGAARMIGILHDHGIPAIQEPFNSVK